MSKNISWEYRSDESDKLLEVVFSAQKYISRASKQKTSQSNQIILYNIKYVNYKKQTKSKNIYDCIRRGS